MLYNNPTKTIKENKKIVNETSQPKNYFYLTKIKKRV